MSKKILKIVVLILIIFFQLSIVSCQSNNKQEDNSVGSSLMQYPEKIGYINDYINIISKETEEKILTKIQKVYKETGTKVFLVTSEPFKENDVEKYTENLFEIWELTSKDVLIYIIIEDPLINIATGNEVGKTITDYVAKRVIDDAINPKFNENKFESGIYEGIIYISNYILCQGSYRLKEL